MMADTPDSTDLLENEGAGAGDWHRWHGGKGVLFVEGTLGTTNTFQTQGPNGTAIPVATITATGVTNFELPPCLLRMNISGGSPSGIYARAVRFRV